MEEAGDIHEESAPKRSRSDEEIKSDKDVSLSTDSGQQSPHDKQQQEIEQNINASSSNSNNNNSNNSNSNSSTSNHFINNNSDSGLSMKMEDSSCGDADVSSDGVLKSKIEGGKNPTTSADASNQQKETKRQMLNNEIITKNEEATPLSTDKQDSVATTSSGIAGDRPTTSATHIKRQKRNRSRSYRVTSRSSSSSSSSSNEHHPEIQTEGRQSEREGDNDDEDSSISGESMSPDTDDIGEDLLPSPYMFLPNFSIDSTTESYDDHTDAEEVNKVLNKEKPPYTWSASYELMRREHGLNADGRTSIRNGFSCGFKNRFYASRHVVERMKISHVLRKHSGCVNCVNFNKTGDLLVTGSDDARLIVWDWAANKTKHVWKSGHSANIFQSKFLPSSSCIDIISAGRDGKVRRSIVPPSGGKVHVSHLYLHAGAVHKLVICPDHPSQVISVDEEGCICSKDLREDNPKVEMLRVYSTTRKTRRVPLFSISHHPYAPEICVSGSDQYVRVYDKRSMKTPVHSMSPEHILETNSPNVTCCVYNNTGTEILATYSEDNIYLFDNKNYVPGEFLHCYRGHFNQKTIKGVNFFGPNCEYVISGSDCGNIFYWDKNTEAILNFMPGDTAGVVNCLEPHPTTPILATSGLDHNIKIWTPSADKHPLDVTKLTNCVRRNIRRVAIHDGIDSDSSLQFVIRQILCSHRRRNRRNRNENDSDSDNNDSNEDSSLSDTYSENDDTDEEDDDVDVSNLRHMSCGTQ